MLCSVYNHNPNLFYIAKQNFYSFELNLRTWRRDIVISMNSLFSMRTISGSWAPNTLVVHGNRFQTWVAES